MKQNYGRFTFTVRSAAVATLVKARATTISVSRSNPGGATFVSCISKVEKERLSLTTPASGMKALAQIGAWHNSLDRMPAVILVSPLLNYFF